VSLAFSGGVALGAWLPQEPAAWGWAAVGTLAVWAALFAAGRLRAGSRVGLAVFIILGVYRIQGDLAPLYSGCEPLAEGDAVASGRIARSAEIRDGEMVLLLDQARLRRNGVTAQLALPLQIIVTSGGEGYSVGDLVTVRGRVRSIRGDRNLGWFPSPITTSGKRSAARLIVASGTWIRREGRDPGRGPGAVVLGWRAAADAYWKTHPGAAGQILNSLTTGERAGIPPEIQETFLRSGLTHLLAISGMNVGFLGALVFLLLRRGLSLLETLALRIPIQPIAAVLTLPSLWFFMLFSGSQIPVGRAVLSSAAGLAAVILWRRVHPSDAWALAALAIVAWDPRSLFSASFQLSFAAVAALMLVASRVLPILAPPGLPGDGRLQRLCRGTRSLFVVSLAASALTAPLVAFHFQKVSLVGPLANLIAVPFTGFVVLPAGWLALVVTALWAPAGHYVTLAALWSAERLVEIAAWFALPAWAVISTARPPLLLTLSLLALACALLPRPTRSLKYLCVFWCAAAAIAGSGWAIATHRQELLVAVLDVGQGLAIAVLLPGGGSLLYDAGPRWRDYDAGERIVVPALRRLGVTHLETLAISHPHPDHDGGVEAVRRELEVGRIWRGEGARALVRGSEYLLGRGVHALVLNPAPKGLIVKKNAVNDRSLALLVSWGETGVVLTGDAGASLAAGLAAVPIRLPAHIVLQVPHHGGSPTDCRIIDKAIRPELSVISVGRNNYGHPRPEAVAAFGNSGRVLRTDRDGAVFMRSDGQRWQVRTWRELTTGRTWTERVRWLVAGW